MTVPLLNSLPTKREMRTDMSSVVLPAKKVSSWPEALSWSWPVGMPSTDTFMPASSRAACSCVSWASMESPASL